MSKRRAAAAASVSEAGTSASGTRATRAKVAHQQDVQSTLITEMASERDAGVIHEAVKNAKGKDYLSPALAVPIYTSLILDFLPPISTRFLLRRLCKASQAASENRGFWSGLKGLETVSIQNAEGLLQLISKTGAATSPAPAASFSSSILSFISQAGSAAAAEPPPCKVRSLKGLVKVDWSTLFLSSDAHITAALVLLSTGTDLKEVALFNSSSHLSSNNASGLQNFISGLALLPKSVQELDVSASIPSDERVFKQLVPVVASHLPHLTSLSLLGSSNPAPNSSALASAFDKLPAALKAIEVRMHVEKGDVSWAKPLASRGLKSLHLVEGNPTRMEDDTLLPGLSLLTSLQELQLRETWSKPAAVGWDLRCSLSVKFWRTLVDCCPHVHTIILNNVCNIKDPEINPIFPSTASKGLTSLKKLQFSYCSFVPVTAIIHDAIASSSPIEVLQFEGLRYDRVPSHVYSPPASKVSFMTVANTFGAQIASGAVGMKKLKTLTLEGRKLDKDEFSSLAKLFPSVQNLSFGLDNEVLNGAELLELAPLKQLRSLSLDLEGRFGMTQKDRSKRLPYTLSTLLEPLFTEANFPSLKELSLNLKGQRMVDESSILEVLSLFVKEEGGAGGVKAEAATSSSSSSSRRGRGKSASSPAAVIPASATTSASSAKIRQAPSLNLVSLNLSSTPISDHAVVELTRHAGLLNLRELYLHNCSGIESQTIDFVRARCRDCIVEFSPPPVRNYVYKKRDLSWIDR